MAIERSLGKNGRYLVLSALIIAFIATASAEGYCTDFKLPVYPITIGPTITIDPSLAYAGQTITIRGTGFNTTPHGSDPYPIAYCNAYCYVNGTMKPIKIQSDGTFIVQPTPNAPGMADIYARDNWGNQSNNVKLTVTYPVTIKANIVDGQNASYVTNGVLCIKYPASGSSHLENSIVGSSYTTKMAYNGTSAEVWVRQNPLTTDHQTIQDIQEGKTYSVTLTMPVNTPVPSATAGALTPTPASTPASTPTQTPQATAIGATATILPGGPDQSAPVTMLNLTGVKDGSGTFTSNVVCTLTAADNDGGSGVNDTGYSFDGSNWTTYTGPFTISTPGNTSVFYRSTDKAGNQELTRVEAVAITGTVSSTPGPTPASGYPGQLIVLLMIIGFAGAYRIRKGRQK